MKFSITIEKEMDIVRLIIDTHNIHTGREVDTKQEVLQFIGQQVEV